MTSQLMQNNDYITLFDCLQCLACTANAGCTVGISSAGNLLTILTNFGGIRHFVPGWPNTAGDAFPGSQVALTPMCP